MQLAMFPDARVPSYPLGRAHQALIHAAHLHRELTADDVWGVLNQQKTNPHSFHHNAVGQAFMDASRAGVIRKTNFFRPSIRPAARSRMVRVWVSAVKAAA